MTVLMGAEPAAFGMQTPRTIVGDEVWPQMKRSFDHTAIDARSRKQAPKGQV
jgi:hypothetical protein